MPDGFLVFYAGTLYGSYAEWPRLFLEPEIYNGGYVYSVIEQKWFSCDGCPRLLQDVPKGIRMSALILT